MKLSHTPIYLTCLFFSACGTTPISPADNHIQQGAMQHSNADIPQTNKRTLPLSPPKPTAKIETYSVVVSNVPAQEILFALARDAKINLDISSGIQGNVSINAINQTLEQILDRISKQVDMRYELDNGTLSVMPDKPFLKTYKIDFINISRTTKSSNSTSGQIGGGSAGAAGASAGNSSSTVTTSDTKNDLMESLVKNVTDIILEEDRLKYKSQKEVSSANRINAQGDGVATGTTGSSSNKAKGTSGESGPAGAVSGAGNESVQASGTAKATTAEFEKSVSVFANKETGVLIARATSRQHEKIQEFIDRVMMTAKRQVMIEATIVEVRLSDRYRQGIDWSRIRLGAQGFTLSQAGTSSFSTTAGALAINYLNPASKYGNLLASIELLEEFGNVKVLSSPKMSVMNNQTASLKVANNLVYFNVSSTTQPCSPSPCTPITAYTTTPVTVAVGFTMSVTPHISDSDMVTINVRPSISRRITDVLDPNPSLLIANSIPVIQTREMESIIKVENGQTAVMGGLIQEEINKISREIPLLARIPLLGNLFQNRDDETIKTELVIFLRPIVIKDASLQGDFKEFSNNLPTADFFHEDARGD